MKFPFCEMRFLSYLYPTNPCNVAKFQAQISKKLKKQRQWFKVHSLKSFKMLFGNIPSQFSGSGKGILSNFPEILLKLSLPHMMNICKIWMKPVKKWRDYKAFQLGDVAGRTQSIHIWPCLKPYYCQTTLVNNPNISGMLVTLPNIEQITFSILWLSKVKGHDTPKLTVFSSCYKFSKIFKPRHGLISW